MTWTGIGRDTSIDVMRAARASAYRTLMERFGWSLSVKDFGAVGDGVTDDTAAFIAARQAWKAAVTLNPAYNSDGNRIGRQKLRLEPSSYLITQAQAFLDSSYTIRTAGMTWEGEMGGGAVQVIFQPGAGGGELLYNNDAVLGLRMKNIHFIANGTNVDFMTSVSNGGAQDYIFEDCSWEGTWRYGLNLSGTNNNSEVHFNHCGIYNTWTAFINSQSSDQFLNYWFNECKVQNISGIFLNMTKGGSIKLKGCDFSGYAPAAGSVLFNLLGNAHAYGVTSFICESARFELNNSNAKVMHCEWPGGTVKFDNCDMTSAGNQSWAQTLITHEFLYGNTPGPTIDFTDCGLMGIHSYASSSNDWQTAKASTYDGCQNVAFSDFYAMHAFSNTNGANYGGWPAVRVRNCRGLQLQTSSYPAWAPNTVYAPGASVYSDQWVYSTSAGGTSGTAQIYGAGTITDGTVTWVSQSIYSGSQYMNDGQANIDVAMSAMGRKRIALFRRYDGNLPSRSNSTTAGSARVILPPKSIITRVFFNVPAGAYSQSSAGSFKIQTDQASPFPFINFTTSGNLSDGFTAPEWNGYYACGTTPQSRAIILQSGTNVSQGPAWPAIAGVEYICGE